MSNSLSELETFIAVVDSGSFSTAASWLRISKSTISKRIASLEQGLGIRLINRNTRQISITNEGQILYERGLKLIQDYDDTVGELKHGHSEPSGPIRVSAPLSFGHKYLAQALIAFMAQYPKIQVKLVLTDRFSNLIAEGLDLAVRLGEMHDSTLIGKQLSQARRLICAAPDYLSRYGTPVHVSELSRHRILQYSSLQTDGGRWPLMGPNGPLLLEVSNKFCANNGEILAETAAAGEGIVLLPYFILRPYLDSGKLVNILPQWTPQPVTLHLLWPASRSPTRRLQLFIEHLSGYFASIEDL